MVEHAVRIDRVAAVTAAQMREVDRLTVDVYGISLLQMMEHAGRAIYTISFANKEVTDA